MIRPALLVFIVVPLIAFSQGYNSIQTRFAGRLDDIKYTGKNKYGYLFTVYTDDDRIYMINSSHIPYFELGDSVIEYWSEYKLKGLGMKNKKFYYPVVK